MPTNENLTWREVGAIVTDAATGGTVSDAFQLLFGNPTKDLLPAGMKLYKFNSFASISRADPPDAGFAMSPWWSPTNAYKHDAGLEQKLKIAKANGVSAREWGRLTSVIKEGWNSLEYLLEIELRNPVYGWFGGFKGMERGGGAGSKRNAKIEGASGSKLPGGATQFYIPNLTYGDVKTYAIRPLS